MISTEDFSQLLAALYAAPLQPEKWQVFFDHLSRLTKISCGYLVTGSEEQGQGILAGGGFSFNPEVLRLYKEHYAAIDPFWAPLLRTPRVSVMQGDEMVSRSRFRNSEFYSDFLARYDMESMTLLSCCSTTEQMGVMPVWRRSQDGPMEEDSLALLRTLLPHANCALQMRTQLQAATVHCEFAEMTLDAISVGAFFVNAAGHVQHMNRLAAALIQTADGLLIENGVLTARDPGERAKLSFFISGAASQRERRSHAVPGGSIHVSRQGILHPLIVTIVPVSEESELLDGLPYVLVLIGDPNARLASRATTMRILYGLTPTESRLSDLLLEGLQVREAAERLGTTLETTRFHVKRVLAKTGARRQSDLMRLMMSLPASTIDGP